MAVNKSMPVPLKSHGGALPVDKNSGYSAYASGANASGRVDDARARLTKGAIEIAGQTAKMRGAGLEALGNVAGAAGKLGLAFVDMGIELDKARAQDAYAQYQLEGQQMRQQLSQLRGQDALGSADGKTPDVQTQMAQWEAKARERYMRNLGGHGRHYFEQHANQFAQNQSEWAQGHQMRELEAYRGQELKTAISVEGRNVTLDPTNDAAVAQSMGRIRGLIEQQGQHNGWSEETTAEVFRQTQEKLLSDAIGAKLAADEFDSADTLINRYAGVLGPVQAAALAEKVRNARDADRLNRAKIAYESDDVAALKAIEQEGATASGGGGTQAVTLTKNRNPAVLGNNISGWGYDGNGHWAKFGSVEEAMARYHKQVKLYNTRDKLSTWGDIARKWRSGGTAHSEANERYVAYIGKASGLDMNAKANVNDINEAARFFSAQAYYENAAKISPAQVAAMLRSGPRGTGTPSKQQASITMMRQNAEARVAGQDIGNKVLSGEITPDEARKMVEKLPTKQQGPAYAQLHQALQIRRAEEDRAKQAAYDEAVDVGAEYQRIFAAPDGGPQKAAEYFERAYKAAENPRDEAGKAKLRALKSLRRDFGLGGSNKMTPDEKKQARAKQLADFRQWYDGKMADGETPEEEEVNEHIRDLGITDVATAAAARSYRGWADGYSQEDLRKKIKSATGKNPSDAQLNAVLTSLQDRLKKKGEMLKGQELNAAIISMMQGGDAPGKWWGNTWRSNMTAGQAAELARSGNPEDQTRAAAFRLEVPDADRERLEAALLRKQPWLMGHQDLIDDLVAIDYTAERGSRFVKLSKENEALYRQLFNANGGKKKQ